MLSAKALSDVVADWQRSNHVVVNARERGIALRISNQSLQSHCGIRSSIRGSTINESTRACSAKFLRNTAN